jgi:hypothetical protein
VRTRGADQTRPSAESDQSWVRHSASYASPQKYERAPQPMLHVLRISGRSVEAVGHFQNRRQPAGTRRVHESEHTQSRADTRDTHEAFELQADRVRECPARARRYRPRTSMVRRRPPVRVRERAEKTPQSGVFVVSSERIEHLPEKDGIDARPDSTKAKHLQTQRPETATAARSIGGHVLGTDSVRSSPAGAPK